MPMLRSVARLVGLLVLVGFVLFLINQVYQVYVLAAALNPTFGVVTLWALIVLLLGLLAAPVYLYFRFPAPLRPPAGEFDREDFLRQLVRRHPQLPTDAQATLEDLEAHLQGLNDRADALIRQTARSVFLTTAISQNGKLDALTVLVTQTRLVWQLSHLYWQRPALRDLSHLYANVGAATLLATEIEHLDISEQIEPVVGSLLKSSAVKTIPVVGPAARLVADSLLEGAVNAYLTLRVGVIAKRYCGTPEVFEPKRARRAAFAEAAVMLRKIVLQSSGDLVNAVLAAGRKAGTDTLRSGQARVRSGWQSLTGPLRRGNRPTTDADPATE